VISQNRKARHDFVVLDTLECGLQLVGSEVKSLRAGKVSLDEAYGRVRNGEVWLMGCDIQEYAEANPKSAASPIWPDSKASRWCP